MYIFKWLSITILGRYKSLFSDVILYVFQQAEDEEFDFEEEEEDSDDVGRRKSRGRQSMSSAKKGAKGKDVGITLMHYFFFFIKT